MLLVVRGFVLSEHLVKMVVAILAGLFLMSVTYGFVSSFSQGDFVCKMSVGLKAWGATDNIRCRTNNVYVPPRATEEEAAKIVADEMIGCWNQFGSGNIEGVIPYGLNSGVRSVISIPEQIETFSFTRKRCFVCAQVGASEGNIVVEDLPLVLKSEYLNDQSYYQRLYPDPVRVQRYGRKLVNDIDTSTVIVVYEEDREDSDASNGVVAYSYGEFQARLAAGGFFGEAAAAEYQSNWDNDENKRRNFAICGLRYDEG